MYTVLTDDPEEPAAEMPEDVATLYSWANLQGAKYRDFSGSRREYRAQMRHRTAEGLLQTELKDQVEAEKTANGTEHAAYEAQQRARALMIDPRGGDVRERAVVDAQDAARRAAGDRVEAARRAEAAAIARVAAGREERVIAGARASALRQSARWIESEARRRSLAGPQPVRVLQGMVDAEGVETEKPARQADPSIYEEYVKSGSADHPAEGPAIEISDRQYGTVPVRRLGQDHKGLDFKVNEDISQALTEGSNAPAWLYADVAQTLARPSMFSSTEGDTQPLIERAGLQGLGSDSLFEGHREPLAGLDDEDHDDAHMPVLALFSLAGGAGKTSLAATLGRILSSFGEKVLLAEMTSYGLLPYYFGASEPRPGVLRDFSPPTGSTEASVHLISYDVDQRSSDPNIQDGLVADLEHRSSGSHRILLDLGSSAGWLLHRLSRMNLTLLVPVAPDMNSVILLAAMERYFNESADRDGRILKPIYLLNHFDASLPLHLDVREMLRRQLGDRLLPFYIRRSPAISESLAEGMTLVDYAPEAPAVEDYRRVARWLRALSAPASKALRTVLWSEQ